MTKSIHPFHCHSLLACVFTVGLMAGCDAPATGDLADSVTSDQAFLDTATFEAENLTRTASSVGSSVVTDSAASGGKYVQLAGTPAVGAYIEFTLPNVAAGTYDIAVFFKSNNNRGINQAKIDSTTLTTTCDEYQSASQYGRSCTVGRATVTAGNHPLRFTITGKNGSSSGYTMVVDKIVLTPVGGTSVCPAGYTLKWSDDFNGAAGAAVDGSKWTYDVGKFYNNEQEYYRSGNSNAALDGNGNLVITAKKETYGGMPYTSARLKTQGLASWAYGHVEARIRLPYGQGMWPAFWAMGANVDTVPWPGCGEIDIMENIGREPNLNHGVMHGPGYSGAQGPASIYTLPSGKLSDAFHVFAIDWEVNKITWSVDGQVYGTKTPASIPGKTWVFDHPFFIIMNVAVGGDWPGNPDSTTVFPQKMTVDYVRVCQK